MSNADATLRAIHALAQRYGLDIAEQNLFINLRIHDRYPATLGLYHNGVQHFFHGATFGEVNEKAIAFIKQETPPTKEKKD